MMGTKLQLMFWELPEDGFDWVIEVHPTGEVAIRFYDKVTKAEGRMSFDDGSDLDFIKSVMHRIGFKPKQG